MREASPLSGALAGRCPRCKSKTLFAGWVRFADQCRACDLDFSSFNVGDGPAAFLIFIVGAGLVAGALSVDGAFSPPWWVHIVWIPIGLAMTIIGLRLGKALLLTQEFLHRAREGRIVE
ncbi:MAG: DUF983 domain-containing protein [Sphingomicrobium sp.]